MKMLQDDGKLEKTALALPISYSCKFLADNKQAFVNLSSTYTKRTCVPVKSDKIKCQLVLSEMKYVSGDADKKDFAYAFYAQSYMGDARPEAFKDVFFMSEKGVKNTENYFSIKKGESYTINARSNTFEVSLADFESGNFNLQLSANFKTWWTNAYFSELAYSNLSIKEVIVLGQQAAAAPEQNAKTLRASKYDVVVEFKFYLRKVD
jgi:hypothetical protein